MNFSKIASVIQGITDPKQAISLALGALGKKNPKQAELINNMINSGKSPVEAIKNAAAQGTINKNQLTELQSIYKTLKGFGVKINIPKSVWDEAENAINSASNINTQQHNNNSNMKGF